MIQRSILYFVAQTYPNKELLISYPEDDRLTRYVVNRRMLELEIDILIIERPSYLSLGESRNHAVKSANGEFVCTWDDDDFYHSSRLQFQFESLSTINTRFEACILNQIILFDRCTNIAYLSFLYTWENTLFCKKTIFNQMRFSCGDLGEDSKIVDLLDKNHLLLHVNAPYLYIYIFHKGNSWSYHHFKSFAKRSTPLAHNDSNLILGLIQ
jgi:glycosyltransferase involved in cell wall biosynthesis